jgi:carbon storage regulator
MLVLSRRVGEEIVIDGQTRLIILGVKAGVTRLGFIAPTSVRVDRKELHDRILSGRGRKAKNGQDSA